MADREKAVADWGKSGNCSSKRAQKRWQTGNEGEVGCQPRNTANLPHVVLVSCGKTGCLLGSKSGQSEKEGNSRKKREIDGKAVKTSSRASPVSKAALDSGNASLRRFWFQNRHSLQFLRVSAARTVHYGPPLYLRARKSHTHEHMAMVYNLTRKAGNFDRILT